MDGTGTERVFMKIRIALSVNLSIFAQKKSFSSSSPSSSPFPSVRCLFSPKSFLRHLPPLHCLCTNHKIYVCRYSREEALDVTQRMIFYIYCILTRGRFWWKTEGKVFANKFFPRAKREVFCWRILSFLGEAAKWTRGGCEKDRSASRLERYFPTFVQVTSASLLGINSI